MRQGSLGWILHNLLVVGHLVLLELHQVLLTDLLLIGESSGCTLWVVDDYLLAVAAVRGTGLVFSSRLLHLEHLLASRLHLNETLNQRLRVHSRRKHPLFRKLHNLLLLLPLLNQHVVTSIGLCPGILADYVLLELLLVHHVLITRSNLFVFLSAFHTFA